MAVLSDGRCLPEYPESWTPSVQAAVARIDAEYGARITRARKLRDDAKKSGRPVVSPDRANVGALARGGLDGGVLQHYRFERHPDQDPGQFRKLMDALVAHSTPLGAM